MSILIYIMIVISIFLIIVSIVNINIAWTMKKHNSYLRAKVYDKYKVVTLCGSSRFKDEFDMINKELTLRGHIVISLGCFGHSGDTEAINDNNKKVLDNIHKRKIDLASAIMVVNKNNYIGESTQKEIEYAKATNKEVFYWYK